MSIQSEIDRIEQNVANTYTALSDLGADMPTPKNSDNLAQTVGTAKAVLYMEQTLTEEQQAQARENIGAGLPVLEVTITENEDGTYAADKTPADISAAYAAGRFIYAIVMMEAVPIFCYLFGITEDNEETVAIFSATNPYSNGLIVVIIEDGFVMVEQVDTQAELENLTIRIGNSIISYNGTTARTLNVTSLKNPYALTINGTSYDGSEEVSMYIGDSGVLPQQYGAKGDGTTDDTAAFQAALAENRVVNVPGGTYLLSDTLTIGANCCLELSQDTVLKFSQTAGNCIVLQGSATLRGNHAIISVPYAFAGNALAMDTNLETDTIIPPYLKVGSHMFKRQRFVYDINVIKPDAAGFCRSDDGTCTGTAVYMSADSTTSHMWMWAINISGLRIAGGFSYGIHAINYDSPAGSSGHYEDDAWNHDMRIEAVIEACEIGVALENCNGAHLAVTIQPSTAQNNGAKYAKHGVYLNDSKFVEMIGSRVWDWNDKTTLWTMGGEYQHLALIGNCRGLLLDDFLVNETSTPIQELIYTDRPANFDTMSVLQEPGSKYFKAVEGEPYFDTGTPARLALKTDIDEYFVTDRVPGFTDALATAIDTDGSIYNGIGYNKHGGALDSSGTKIPDTEAYYGHTGFIACKAGDTIYIKGIAISNNEGYTKAFAYDANFNLLGQNNTASILAGTTTGVFTGKATEDGGTLTPVKADTAYMRLSFKSTFMGDDPIISVNKEIKFEQAGFLADSIKVKAENVVGNLPDGGASVPADWNAAEGEPGHVLNRTHYKEMRTLVDEEVSSGVDMYIPTPFDIIKGRAYTVTVDGVSYNLIAKTAFDGEVSYFYLGSGQIFGFEDDDAETPFIIISVDGEFGMMFADGRTDTISLRVQTEVYVPLSYEYIPEQKYVVVMETSDASGSSDSSFQKTMDTTMLVKALQNDWPVWLDFSAFGTTSEKVLVQGWKTNHYPLNDLIAYGGEGAVQLYLFAARFSLNQEKNIVVYINMKD